MDDQEFKELVLKEIKDAKAFRKNIKDALKKALYGDFDFNVLTPLGEECPHEREKYIKAPHEEGREGSGYAGTYYGIWNYCDCSFTIERVISGITKSKLFLLPAPAGIFICTQHR